MNTDKPAMGAPIRAPMTDSLEAVLADALEESIKRTEAVVAATKYEVGVGFVCHDATAFGHLDGWPQIARAALDQAGANDNLRELAAELAECANDLIVEQTDQHWDALADAERRLSTALANSEPEP